MNPFMQNVVKPFTGGMTDFVNGMLSGGQPMQGQNFQDQPNASYLNTPSGKLGTGYGDAAKLATLAMLLAPTINHLGLQSGSADLNANVGGEPSKESVLGKLSDGQSLNPDETRFAAQNLTTEQINEAHAGMAPGTRVIGDTQTILGGHPEISPSAQVNPNAIEINNGSDISNFMKAINNKDLVTAKQLFQATDPSSPFKDTMQSMIEDANKTGPALGDLAKQLHAAGNFTGEQELQNLASKHSATLGDKIEAAQLVSNLQKAAKPGLGDILRNLIPGMARMSGDTPAVRQFIADQAQKELENQVLNPSTGSTIGNQVTPWRQYLP